MKELVKRIIGFGIPLFSFFMLASVFAATTELIVGPDIIPGDGTVYLTGARRNLTGSTKTAKGSNCKFYFTTGGTISNYLQPWSNRKLTVALWDYDFANDNDKIKYTKGNFSGRELISFDSPTTLISGAVEDSDDPTAELFISYYLTKNSEDTSGEGTGHFFSYRLENA